MAGTNEGILSRRDAHFSYVADRNPCMCLAITDRDYNVLGAETLDIDTMN
jgi:hypothetical protein